MPSTKKSLYDAIKKLPKEIQHEFYRTWLLADCIDIYDGDLESYMRIIRRRFEQKIKAIDASVESLTNIRRR